MQNVQISTLRDDLRDRAPAYGGTCSQGRNEIVATIFHATQPMRMMRTRRGRINHKRRISMTQEKHDISRRNFLTGAGIVAASAAAMGLAGCAPKSASSASTSSSSTSSASGSTVGFDGSDTKPWLGAEPSISDSDVEQTLSADVIICGLGDSGVPAARAAAEAGASLICFEKAAAMTTTGSDMAVLGGTTQATWGRGDGTFDKTMIVNRHMSECSYHNKFGIINRWADESGAMLDWFIKPSTDLYISPESYSDIPQANQKNYLHPYFVPMLDHYDYTKEDLPCYPTSVGFSSLSTVMKANLQIAIDKGADIHYGCPVAKLIVENGAVTGVYAKNTSTGKYIKATAKSVVLATGDYNSNTEMLKYYQPEVVANQVKVLTLNKDTEGNACNMGDGHKMGAWIGAAIEQWHAPMIHHMGGGAGADGRGVIGNNGYLWLNMNGERFMNEDLPGQQLENQVELLPDRKGYQFFDSKWPEQLQWFPAAHGVACIYRDTQLPDYTASGLKINVRCPADIEQAVTEGRCIKADTIDELLSKISGMNAATAKKSIEHYNQLCEAGVDSDFGKKATRLFALKNPPYYACECGEALTLANLGGLESDENCHVFDANRQQIKGLYVCGGVQGGRFNVEYPISLKGLSISMCVLYGKVAGTNAAKQA